MKLATLLLAALVPVSAQTASLDFLNHNRPVLDAHNCYPYQGRWADRIDRALKSGFPVSIEQDLAWYAGPDARRIDAVSPSPVGLRSPSVRV